MHPWVRLEVWLKWFAHPLGGVVCRGHAQYPAFASHSVLLFLALQKCQLGFLVSLYLLPRICSNCACTQLISVPYSFFVFCSSRRGMSSCKFCSPAAKGSRTQPASKRLMQSTKTLLAPAFLEYGMMGAGRGWGHCRRRSFHHHISNI